MLLLESLLVLGTWLCSLAVFTGIGLALRRTLAVKDSSRPGADKLQAEKIFDAFWAGWVLALVLLQFWHLFFPVNRAILLLLMLAGLAGLSWNMAALKQWAWDARRAAGSSRFGWIYLAGMLIFGLWLANQSLGPINNGDMGLYHLPAVRWNTTYAIVPGLGNLHGRLAFNSSYFLYVAVYEAAGLYGKSYHFANGLLMLAFSAQAGWVLARRLAQPAALKEAEKFTLVVSCFLPYLYIEYAPNIANDLSIFLLGAVLGEQLLQLIFSNEPGPHERVFAILFLTAAGTTIKISFLALGAASSAVALVRWAYLRTQQHLPLLPRRSIFWLAAPAILLLWAGRGILLSGYPAYPVTIGGLNVAWKIPENRANDMVRLIASWSRAPGKPPEQVMSDWAWLLPKLKKGLNRFPEFILPLALAGVGGLLFLKRFRRWLWPPHTWRAALAGRPLWHLLFLLPAVVSLAYWFFTSPNIRFVGVAFWWLAAGGLIAGLDQMARPRPFVTACGLLFAVFLLTYLFLNPPWITAGPTSGLIAAPAAPSQEFITRSGLRLFVPTQNDQCWDAPLPCTPYPDEELHLLQPGSLQDGFSVRE